MDFSKEEIEELKNIIQSVIDDGYDTNLVTKKIAHKLLTVQEMKFLDDVNIGIKLLG